MANVAMLSTIADQTASQIAGAASALMPSGVILPFGGTTAPTGWLICDGSAISRTTYAALFSAVGTTHGTGDGSTTFNLPDMRGVFPRGAGTNATSNYGGVIGHTPAGGTVGNKGGQKTAKNGLSGGSGNQSQSHTHSANHDHASANTNTTGAHFHQSGITIAGGGFNADAGIGGGSMDPSLQPDTSTEGDHFHSVDLPNLAVTTGSNSVDHTHAVTVSSTDTETTPASLSLNYIIKL